MSVPIGLLIFTALGVALGLGLGILDLGLGLDKNVKFEQFNVSPVL